MNGALHEEIKIVNAFPPASRATATAQFNGAVSASASGIDTLGFEDALVSLNLGAISTDSVVFDLLAHSTDSAALATAVLSPDGVTATKTVVDADDNKTFQLRFKPSEHKRYLFVKATAGGAIPIFYQVSVALGKARSVPVTQSQPVAFTDA